MLSQIQQIGLAVGSALMLIGLIMALTGNLGLTAIVSVVVGYLLVAVSAIPLFAEIIDAMEDQHTRR